MTSLEDKHFEHIAKMQALTDNAWYSWNSPIGLSIFFLSLALMGLIGVFAFTLITK